VFGQHRHDLSCRGSKKLKNHPHPQNTAKTKEKITSPLIDTHPDQMRPVLADIVERPFYNLKTVLKILRSFAVGNLKIKQGKRNGIP
jgi:hypothetical protein